MLEVINQRITPSSSMQDMLAMDCSWAAGEDLINTCDYWNQHERLASPASSSEVSNDCSSDCPSSPSSSIKRLFDESQSTDFMDCDEQTDDETPVVDDRQKRLKSRCDRVVQSLSREIKLVEVLDGVRNEIQARKDMALKAARVCKSEGKNLLVVLLALKWKNIALNEEMEVEEMAYNARMKSKIYLKNQVIEAMRMHQKQQVC